MNVDIWSDIACPWCYIGKRRFEKALADFPHKDQVNVTWHSFQLDPNLPEHFDGTEAEYLSARKGMPIEQVEAMFAHVKSEAAKEGLAYDFDALKVANSFLGHQLLHLVQENGLGSEAKEALLSAHFEHGKDIGSVDELVAIAQQIGMDPVAVRSALEINSKAEEVREDIARAGQLGIQGVPFFVFDMSLALSGAQPVEVFRQVLDEAWAKSPKLQMANVPGAQSGTADSAINGKANGAANQAPNVCGPDGCTI